MDSKEMKRFADLIRLETVKELHCAGFGHYGGCMSVVETLAVVYGKWMRVKPENPNWEGRDYFVLSKGHAGPSYYATLALKGFFDKSILKTLNKNGTTLPSHPDRKMVKGVDATTGSLGQGISIATGIALSLKLDKTDQKVYTIVGDGELNEGQCWEAIQFAAHHGLNNLVVFVDENKKQLDGYTNDICKSFDFVKKFEAFGFHTTKIVGSDVESIDKAIQDGFLQTEKPIAIILDTVKGQGLPFIEKMEANHHVRPDNETHNSIEKYIADLDCSLKKEGGCE